MNQVQNHADEEQVAGAQKKQKKKLLQSEDDLKFLLKTEQGRRFLWRLLSVCGLYKQSAEASGSWTYFNEGKRWVGNKFFFEIVKTDPDAYTRMIKEDQKGDSNE